MTAVTPYIIPSMTTAEQNAKIEEFINLFRVGVEAWIRAGEVLVELVESDPHVYDWIIAACPTLNASILARFEQMGRKNLHPQLLLTNSPGFSKLQKLPYSLQERYVQEPIPLIVHTKHGTDVLLVEAKNMTKEQADQVFAGNRLRTEGEQKAWLMQQMSNKAKPAVRDSKPWRLSGNALVVKTIDGELKFPASQLASFLSQLTA